MNPNSPSDWIMAVLVVWTVVVLLTSGRRK
jgi:hypothetical protein